MTSEERFMHRAIELSINGFPAPNPHVGCVIARNNEIVGEGFHDHAGGPHAEVVALGQAGDKARGADAYVTLEPCNHTGRTGPCSQALIQAGVARVRVATRDPHPKAAGGLDALKQAGIAIKEGVLQAEARRANERWLTAVERGWPFVEAKVAMSLDGRVALPSGESKWITNEVSRGKGHWLRAQCGAVLVGRRTVTRDDPHLTARIDGVVNQPTRIIFDPNSALTRREKVFDDVAPTWHIVRQPLHEGQIRATTNDSGFDLQALLKDFYERGLTSVLVEGGPITLGHLMRQGLVDRLNIFVAPKALGSGPSWIQEELAHLADAPQFNLVSAEPLDGDVWLTYRPSAS
jgi:diaminohydroxyphosphoribosylaminopyrimidine deaminase/5-amino-6-(5-phosphoribosylamino)uracil reductase